MSNIPTTGRGAPTIPKPQQREITIPGATGQKKSNVRVGLLLIGILLIAGSVFAFWFILQSLDQRQQVLVTARNIERWTIVSASDFTVVQASPGDASYMTVNQLPVLIGRWASGTIPAGSIISFGMFETPPLSGEEEADKVLLQVTIPASEAPFGTINTGDTIALFGSLETDLGLTATSLIGVLRLDLVQGNNVFYNVSPQEARNIQEIADTFTSTASRKIWKLGTNVQEETLRGLYGDVAIPVPLEFEPLGEEGSGIEPVQDQAP